MKKLVSLLLAAIMVFALAACGNKTTDDDSGDAQTPETITITALNASGEAFEQTVPYDPQRVAILDFAALDIMDNLGLGDRVVGCASTTLDYLEKYTTDENVTILGTIKEADLESVMACEPDIIFIGGRLSASYDALSEIATVVYLATDSEIGVVESTRKNATTIASIFGKEDEIAEKMAGFDARIEALQEFAADKTALVGMCTNGGFNLLGNDGRCAIIGTEIGFENLGLDAIASNSNGGERGGSGEGGRGEGGRGEGGGSEGGHGEGGNQGGSTATHGNEASFELIVSLNPDYIFVMDRDASIGTDGAQLAQEIMENELVMKSDAYKNGNIVYLAHPAAWYTAEGGVTALDLMLSDLETALFE